MEEEDPVVQEIPVYLSQALAENLYIYQYPLRPANRNYRDIHVMNASVKPKNKMVRLEIALDTDSDKFCMSKAEQIAINTDGHQESSWHVKEKDKSVYFKNGVMDKIVYESSNPCTETDYFAVAILQDKELHCTPIQGIIQLRPSFSYIDKQNKRKQDKSKADSSDEDDNEPIAKQVTVKFARQETEMAKKVKEKSYEMMMQRIAAEPWYDALWKSYETDQAELERLKLFSATTSDATALTLSAREYIKQIVPPSDDTAQTKLPPPTEQIKELISRAKIMTFNELLKYIRTDNGPISETSLLSALSGSACCVRGLWTARSSDLYTNQGAVHPRILAAARDHVLYLFTQNTYVDRKSVNTTVRLPPDLVLEIISSVAKLNQRQHTWELIIPPDTAFENKYPDVVTRQNLYWEARQRQFNEMLMAENVPKRQRKKSQRDSIGSDMSPKPKGASEEDGDRKRQKNKSTTGGGKRTRNVSSSSAHDVT